MELYKQSRKEVIFLGKAKKTRDCICLDQYIRKKKNYATYKGAYKLYSMNYYAFVRLVKEANAGWKIRKTVIVDLDKLEAYMENFKDKGE